MKKPKIQITEFQRQMNAERRIKQAKERGRSALANAADMAANDRRYRAAKGIVEPQAKKKEGA